jgi:hypothetical protein
MVRVLSIGHQWFWNFYPFPSSQNPKSPCKESSSSFGAIHFDEVPDDVLLLW